MLLIEQGRYDEAAGVSRQGLGTAPFSPELRFALACALLVNSQNPEEGAAQLQLAFSLKPNWPEAHGILGQILTKQKRLDQAISEYSEALRLKPELPEVLNNLAWIRAANPQAGFRDGAEAVRLAERACRLTGYKQPMLVGTLAVAYAEAGRFEEAVAAAGRARDLALACGQEKLAEKNQKLVQLFNARQPYRETEETPGP